MKILLPQVDRQTAYRIISLFHEVLKGMNYPVSSYRPGKLEFVDIDEGFMKMTICYDNHTRAIVMKK